MTTTDGVGGRAVSRVTEQRNVHCWEQTASTSEVAKYGKLGMSVNSKIYFKADPQITDQHEIVITARMVDGVLTTVEAADEVILQNLLPAKPDASSGLGVLWRVLVNDIPGSAT